VKNEISSLERNLFDDSDYDINIFESLAEKSKDLIFIASAWQRPIGYEKLKQTHLDFKNKRKLSQIELEDKFYKNIEMTRDAASKAGKKIETTEKEFRTELDRSKRETVKTLGVFASFLALATIAFAAFTEVLKNDIEVSAFLRIMLSFVFCLSVFVLLLEFVIQSNQNRKRIAGYFILFLIALIATILIFI
jgi:hypothetical protein